MFCSYTDSYVVTQGITDTLFYRSRWYIVYYNILEFCKPVLNWYIWPRTTYFHRRRQIICHGWWPTIDHCSCSPVANMQDLIYRLLITDFFTQNTLICSMNLFFSPMDYVLLRKAVICGVLPMETGTYMCIHGSVESQIADLESCGQKSAQKLSYTLYPLGGACEARWF